MRVGSLLPSLPNAQGFAENGYSFRYTSRATPAYARYAYMADLEFLFCRSAPNAFGLGRTELTYSLPTTLQTMQVMI